MTVRYRENAFTRLGSDAFAAWRGIGAAEVSDCLGRAMAMQGAISPLAPGMSVVGQARTVHCMVADNSALHAAITVAEPGDVLVAAAQGFEDAAIWGGLMTRAAMARGVAGLVVDGAIRDSDEITSLGFACFARGAVPRGPHKGFGGAIDVPISCGGVQVMPGDLIVGDADGVTVVPFARITETLEAVHALHAKEKNAIAAIEAGGSLAEVYGVPKIETIRSDD